MIHLLVLAVSLFTANNMVLVDFNTDYAKSNWTVVDDVVMGGRSDGHFQISPEGHGVFSGNVSLENNGGFSSVRCRIEKKDVSSYRYITIRLKGDGKRYQFRVKSSSSDRHAYIHYFQTTGDWQTIEIPLADMTPSFRGRTLDMPQYSGRALEEIAFLIANKTAEPFRLEIDKISLE